MNESSFTSAFLELLDDLVGINSVNPAFPGGVGDAEAGRYCRDWLERHGVATELVDAAPGRPNLYATIPGRGEAPPLLLNSHFDTVDVEGMEAPFRLRVDGDRAHGRGTYDMKASVAIEMLLAAWLGGALPGQDTESGAPRPPAGDLHITLVSDEEDLSVGMEALVRDWLPGLAARPGGAVVLEPSEETLAVAHKGFAWLEVDLAGRAAHGSRPHLGVDAIARLGPLLRALAELQARLEARPEHPLLGHASLHAGTVEGGTAWSVYPAHATLRYERRILPEDDDPLEELDELLERIGYRVAPAAAAEGEVEVDADRYEVRARRRVFERRPHLVGEEEPVVRGLAEATRGATGSAGEIAGVSFWTDAGLLGEAGLPTVVYGPAGAGAHAVVEWVSVSSCWRVFDSLRRLADAGLPAG